MKVGPKEILIAAKQLIGRPEAWLQHHGCDSTGRLCASYAILKALRPIDILDDPHSVPRMHAAEILEKAIGGGYIFEWNDASRRTHKQVMKAFDKAIALADAR